MKQIKLLELFGGIGSSRLALQNLGYDVEAKYVDIDKFATKSYNAIFEEDNEPIDINEFKTTFKPDIITHTPPCTDFSIAGLRAGGEKGSGTRSSLMWTSLEIISELSPEVFIWENVKGVLSDKTKHTFVDYIKTTEEMGYTTTYKVLNATDFGSAQNRERLFAISIKNTSNKTFNFDNLITNNDPNALVKTLDLELLSDDMKFYTEDNFKHYHTLVKDADEYLKVYQWRRKYVRGMNGKRCPTLTANMGTGGNNVPIVKTKYGHRRLTTTECWALMGFNRNIHDKAKSAGVSNSQLYKQAGNSIVVTVLESIFKELYKN